ncbi:NAD(P)H-dependent oxidoreductase [Lacinutrix salivirga]
MNVIESLNWRYATKKFDTTRIISQDKINTITQAFNLTATSFGLQPIKLVVINNKKLQTQLVPFTMNQIQVEQASHVLVFCINRVIDKEFVTTYFNLVKKIRQTPDTILKPFEDFLIEDFNNKPQKEIELWATKQAYLAMGNLLTVCALEQIDSCPMEGFSPKDYDTLLKLEQQNLKSVLVMPIGYRAEDDMFSALKKIRKPLIDMVINV